LQEPRVTAIVWFDRDLRLADHPALGAASARHGSVVPVFVWDPDSAGDWAEGAASRWWLHHSLVRFDESLRRRGSRLVIRRGDARRVIPRLAVEAGAEAVYWCRRHQPGPRTRDGDVADELEQMGIASSMTAGHLLFEPDTIANRAGEPYRVFTPFWRAATGMTGALQPPEAAPDVLPEVDRELVGDAIEDLGLLPRIPWDAGLRENWTPGEAGARDRLEDFLSGGVRDYAQMRDRVDHAGTSRLSPHLAWGEISPRQIWWQVRQAEAGAGGDAFLREVGWREFSHHLLWHFPESATQPLDPRFRRFEWRDDIEALARWQRGMTGIPLVDAGMRELWHTGWMHNRLRMVVASFLTKNLLIPWQAGARWFWDTLVDADLANNTQGWQWTAGSGADAAPFFRIFNPVRQAEKADPDGRYVRRWVPELAALPDTFVHQPWKAPDRELDRAGIIPGRDYPEPLVDLLATRRRALDRFDRIKRS